MSYEFQCRGRLEEVQVINGAEDRGFGVNFKVNSTEGPSYRYQCWVPVEAERGGNESFDATREIAELLNLMLRGDTVEVEQEASGNPDTGILGGLHIWSNGGEVILYGPAWQKIV